MKLTVTKLEGRKGSVDSIPSLRKDDIFGKSYDKEMQQKSSVRKGGLPEEVKGMAQA